MIDMTFAKALFLVAQGKKVRRAEWEDLNVHLALVESKLCIFSMDDNQYHPLTVTLGDMLGDDWEVM